MVAHLPLFDPNKKYKRRTTQRREEQLRALHQANRKSWGHPGKGAAVRAHYAEQAELQRGKCAICGDGGELLRDHCHSSGKPRGWLCWRCNTALGNLKDDTAVLLQAVAYLEKWHG